MCNHVQHCFQVQSLLLQCLLLNKSIKNNSQNSDKITHDVIDLVTYWLQAQWPTSSWYSVIRFHPHFYMFTMLTVIGSPVRMTTHDHDMRRRQRMVSHTRVSMCVNMARALELAWEPWSGNGEHGGYIVHLPWEQCMWPMCAYNNARIWLMCNSPNISLWRKEPWQQ